MRKIAGIIVLMLVVIAALSVNVCEAQFDDVKRSIEDSKRSMKIHTQPLQQNVPNTIDTHRYDAPDSPSKDRAVARNEELMKTLLEQRNRDLGKEMDEWLTRFRKQYGFIVEVLVVALFITGFSIFFYKQKIKRMLKKEQGDKKETPQAYRYPTYRG